MSPVRGLRQVLAERARAGGIVLIPAELELLDRYWELLARWNEKINLTGLPLRNDPSAALDRLILEPISAARVLSARALDWVDFGSGAGSPAIPLKIVRPRARLAMVESRGRKAAFLREVIRRLELQGTAVAELRIEELVPRASAPLPRASASVLFQPACAELVTIRSVALSPPVLRTAAALLKSGGRLLLFEQTGFELPGPAPFELVEKIDFPFSKAAALLFVRR